MNSNVSPRVSVVMPVYNAAETLDRAIQSISDQSFDNFEFIIVDDGSRDSSPEIIRQWTQQDSRINPVFRNHYGMVPALNCGIQKARGQYIARMDADDISLPNRLRRQAEFLDQYLEIGIVSCLVEHLGDGKKQQGYARYVNWINSLISHQDISLNRFIESPLAHPSVMFRRELIERHGGYRNGDFPEDYELWLRWLEQGVQMAKLSEVLLQWRDQSDRLSRTNARYSAEAFYKTKAKYLAQWLSKHNPHHPEIVVWGAGRTSRKRAELLTRQGIHITHYIDVDPNKTGQEIHGRMVWSPDDIPPPGSHFIVSYVGNRGVNRKISAHLNQLGYSLGQHFLFAA